MATLQQLLKSGPCRDHANAESLKWTICDVPEECKTNCMVKMSKVFQQADTCKMICITNR